MKANFLNFIPTICIDCPNLMRLLKRKQEFAITFFGCFNYFYSSERNPADKNTFRIDVAFCEKLKMINSALTHSFWAKGEIGWWKSSVRTKISSDAKARRAERCIRMYMQQAHGEGRRARAVSERRNEIKRRMQKAARWPAAARCFNNRGSAAARAGGGLEREKEKEKRRNSNGGCCCNEPHEGWGDREI